MQTIKIASLFLLLASTIIYAALSDHPDLRSFEGRWRLLDSNYYLGKRLIEHKGDMNVVFDVKIDGKNMIWTSQRGLTKTFYFDFETTQKTVTSQKYTDQVDSTLVGNVLIHNVERKYPNEEKPRKLKNTFKLENQGRTMHHIFEDFNGKDVYKVYSIYGRDPKSVKLNR